MCQDIANSDETSSTPATPNGLAAKVELVTRILRGEKVAPLCRELGVSRSSAYKWLARFRAHGVAGLAPRRRRPKTSPRATPKLVVDAVLAARAASPRAGSRAIASALRETFGDKTPSARTIARIIARARDTPAAA
jgi:hypothetical protein